MKRIFVLIVAIFITSPAFPASVWKVTNGKNTIYVGGTLHLLSEDDYPLPTAYEKAFETSSTIVLETNLDAVNSSAFSQQLLARLSYQDGSTIRAHLSENTYNALSNHFDARGWPINGIQHFKPQLVSLTLTVGELKRMGLTQEGVDSHYANRAKISGKRLGWLETPEQQIEFIVAMGEDDADSLIQYTLEDLKTLPENLSLMRILWAKGDIEAMNRDVLAPFETDYPELYNNILVERNEKWLPALVEYLNTPDTELVLVGALHLPGEKGVLSLLEEQGFKVEKVLN